MKPDILFGMVVSASLIAVVSACKLNQTGCNFIVTCPSTVVPGFSPTCSGEAHTTLIVENSQHYVTRLFVGSTTGIFDQSVREVRGISNTVYNLGVNSFHYYRKCLRIDLAQNNIVTIEGSAFQYLINLESLNLSGNHIVSLKPNSLFISGDKNNKLNVLDLSNNKLILLGSEFNEVPHLRTLYLQGNQLSSIADNAFMSLKDLQQLYLQDNLLTTLNHNLFDLKSLQTLDISKNKLSSLPDDTFKSLKDLNHLYLQDNLLTSLGHILFDLKSLKTFNISHNYLSSLADETFSDLKDLNHLYLQHNRLTFLNNSLIHLKSLQTLNIAYNHLTQLSGHETNSLFSIVDLNMSHNELISIETNSFRRAFDLQKADFSYNKISITIEANMFKNNDNLKYLDFYSNSIAGIQENAFQSCDFEYLRLEKNNVTGDIKEKTFSSLQKIATLDLSGQRFTGIRNKAFADMNNLLHLNLSKNSIVIVEKNSFIRSSITALDLSYNMISNLDFLRNSLTNLIELYVNNNNIAVVSKHTFTHQTQLKRLDISLSQIMKVKDFALPLLNLQSLNFVGNQEQYTIESDTTAKTTHDLVETTTITSSERATFDVDLCNVTEPSQTEYFPTDGEFYIPEAAMRATQNELDIIKKSVAELTTMMKNFSSHVVNQEGKRERAEVEILKGIGHIERNIQVKDQGQTEILSPADKSFVGIPQSKTNRGMNLVLLMKLGVENERGDLSSPKNLVVQTSNGSSP